MDALTDVLETVHLTGSLYCRSELSAPWGMAVPASSAAQFHVVRRGRCRLRLEAGPGRAAERATAGRVARRGSRGSGAGAAELVLEAGDLVCLPRGDAHRLYDAPGSRVESMERLLASCGGTPASGPLVHGGGGERATLICGYFRFDAGEIHPLLSVLPQVILVRGEGGRPSAWMESLLELIAAETTEAGPGGETLINRLTEAMFIRIVRAHLAEATEVPPSWLAGLRDPQVARALGLLHHEPAEAWTVEALADRAGLSRSAFAARFRELVGESPLQYLTRWRMHLAATQLRAGRLPLAEIARRVGYETDAGFSKVFRRLWGVPPAAWRRAALRASGAGSSRGADR
jgi:AraC-like DNA-binding protein